MIVGLLLLMMMMPLPVAYRVRVPSIKLLDKKDGPLSSLQASVVLGRARGRGRRRRARGRAPRLLRRRQTEPAQLLLALGQRRVLVRLRQLGLVWELGLER